MIRQNGGESELNAYKGKSDPAVNSFHNCKNKIVNMRALKYEARVKVWKRVKCLKVCIRNS